MEIRSHSTEFRSVLNAELWGGVVGLNIARGRGIQKRIAVELDSELAVDLIPCTAITTGLFAVDSNYFWYCFYILKVFFKI